MSAASTKDYRRLAGRGSKTGIFAVARVSSRLYLGPDHLLNVETRGWTESYRRYYFSDIQALVVAKTKRALVWNIILGTLAAGLGILLGVGWMGRATWDSSAYVGAWAVGIFCAVFAVSFVVNLLRGPSCRATIQTAISNEVLPSLNRLRSAQKALALLQPQIEQAQGALASDELPVRLAQATPARVIPGRGLAGTHYLRDAAYRGGMHRWTFGLALLAGALALADFFLKLPALALAVAMTIAAVTVCAIMAIVRQHVSNSSAGLRRVTWSMIVVAGLYFIGCYVLLFAVIFKNPKAADNYWLVVKEASTVAEPIYLTVAMFAAVTSLVFGLVGLILTFGAQRSADRAALGSNVNSPDAF